MSTPVFLPRSRGAWLVSRRMFIEASRAGTGSRGCGATFVDVSTSPDHHFTQSFRLGPCFSSKAVKERLRGPIIDTVDIAVITIEGRHILQQLRLGSRRFLLCLHLELTHRDRKRERPHESHCTTRPVPERCGRHDISGVHRVLLILEHLLAQGRTEGPEARPMT